MSSATWIKSVMDTDPRRQIVNYFGPGDSRGPGGYLRANNLEQSGPPSQFFSVWRPTSMSAIRMMMDGTACGKGLNIKAKSAKQGVLSGLVPYLQIHENRHKARVGTSPAAARIQVFYRSRALRERALLELGPMLGEMVFAARDADERVKLYTEGRLDIDDDEREVLLGRKGWTMENPAIQLLDEFESSGSFGIDMPERLFREAYVVRKDITRRGEWETGRNSEPAFQDLSFHATREPYKPRVVVWQFDEEDAMNPSALLTAYAEQSVKPVASDFDCFLIGWRGVDVEPLPAAQQQTLDWEVRELQKVLKTKKSQSWTSRWLGVLKDAAVAGIHHDVPPLGFGDPVTCRMIEGLTSFLASTSGAVRHGAECFNFYFPQELDQSFLVCWHGFENVPWKYLEQPQLRDFLCERISDGFSFPLNPKWLLCDPGWLKVYDALMASKAAASAMDAWYPPALRRSIQQLHEAHPNGFVRLPGEAEDEGDMDPDQAMWALRRFETWQRVKSKLRALQKVRTLGASIKKKSQLTTEADAAMPVQAKVEQPPQELPPPPIIVPAPEADAGDVVRMRGQRDERQPSCGSTDSGSSRVQGAPNTKQLSKTTRPKSVSGAPKSGAAAVGSPLKPGTGRSRAMSASAAQWASPENSPMAASRSVGTATALKAQARRQFRRRSMGGGSAAALPVSAKVRL